MQLTKIDRWLKEKYIYETHILTLRLPEGGLPRGVRVEPIDGVRSSDYRHKLIIKDNETAQRVISLLKENHLMHATHVVEGKHWYNKRLAPDGRSFTYQWIIRGITAVLICVALWGGWLLLQNPVLQSTLKDTYEELKSGM
ncbi:hypothetical protein NT6N_35430 [Oceaniferula spumae]|uniref:Uncharacterized protein n=1 Tax=Oceaniferula spumae TaxID=2979115 RepID=A0AAT9FRD2_9BACT